MPGMGDGERPAAGVCQGGVCKAEPEGQDIFPRKGSRAFLESGSTGDNFVLSENQNTLPNLVKNQSSALVKKERLLPCTFSNILLRQEELF